MTTLNQDRPLVSIGVPVYNEQEHLAQALDSLLAQDYENIEIIISDNASTDETQQICQAYAAKDARVRYERNEANIGGIQNFNRVFDLSRGEFFMWAAGHDIREPTQVSGCMKVLMEDENIVLCYSRVISVDEACQPIQEIHEYLDTRNIEDWKVRINVVLWGLYGGFPIYGVFRSQALKQTSVYLEVVSPDMSLLIELAIVGRFAYIPEPAFQLRHLPDHGDWEAYFAKHFKGKSSGRPSRLYWRMIRQLSQRVAGHSRTIPGKLFGVTCVITVMLIKFRWMLTGLRSIKRNASS